MTAAELDDLAAQFLSRSLPRELWNHTAHLSIGAWHVFRYGAPDALARLRAGIRALNDAHGTPNSPTSGYHETITVAYVTLIDELLATFEPTAPLAERVGHLIAGPLAEKAFLLRFWSRDVLMSDAARMAWVSPDLAPLAWP